MSLRYYITCDRCGEDSGAESVPNPSGWHRLADFMHGTLGTIDLCPTCLDGTGLKNALSQIVLERASAEQLEPRRAQLNVAPTIDAEDIDWDEEERKLTERSTT